MKLVKYLNSSTFSLPLIFAYIIYILSFVRFILRDNLFQVVWNEVQFSERKNFKVQEVFSISHIKVLFNSLI